MYIYTRDLNPVSLLKIFTFIMSLLGTFLVRSGVLNSVHAFANDPYRGVYILSAILFITFFSLLSIKSKNDKTMSKKLLVYFEAYCIENANIQSLKDLINSYF